MKTRINGKELVNVESPDHRSRNLLSKKPTLNRGLTLKPPMDIHPRAQQGTFRLFNDNMNTQKWLQSLRSGLRARPRRTIELEMELGNHFYGLFDNLENGTFVFFG